MTKFNTSSFNDLDVYCGIDVHSNSYSVALRCQGIEVDKFRMDANTGSLIKKISTDYPGARLHSVYEAGFSGFSLHRQLVAAGIHNIVINPADVPTSDKQRVYKSDAIDARKLAKCLETGELNGINIPSVELEQMRSLVRRDTQIRNDTTRCNNRLRMSMHFHGNTQPPKKLSLHYLKELADVAEKQGDLETISLIRQMLWLRDERLRLIKAQQELQEKLGFAQTVKQLMSIPGIGWRAATILQAELGEVTRFKTRDRLASFVGIAPHLNGSGDKEKAVASGNRKQRQLHSILVQSAWAAVRHDSTMRAIYLNLRRKNSATRAIVGVAKKLLLIINAVLRSAMSYDYVVLQKSHPELIKKIKQLEIRTEKVQLSKDSIERIDETPIAEKSDCSSPLPPEDKDVNADISLCDERPCDDDGKDDTLLATGARNEWAAVDDDSVLGYGMVTENELLGQSKPSIHYF